VVGLGLESTQARPPHPHAQPWPLDTTAPGDRLPRAVARARVWGLESLRPGTWDRERSGFLFRTQVFRSFAPKRTSTDPNGSVEDDAIESDLLAEELIAAEPVTITGTESPGNKGTPPAGVLEADGRRKDGRWRRGSVLGEDAITESRNNWKDLLRQAGVVLDFKPDLAADVVAGAVTLNDAFTQAEQIRTSAERKKIMAGIGRGRSGGTVARLHERRVLLRQPCQLRSRLTHRRRHGAIGAEPGRR